MAKTKAQKQEIIATLTSGFQNAASTVFVSFTRITVAEESAMRKVLREAGVKYFVAKKTLIKRVLTEQGRGVCVGKPVAGMEVMVIPISDGAIAVWKPEQQCQPGVIGEFVVRGPVVTERYFRNPKATAR